MLLMIKQTIDESALALFDNESGDGDDDDSDDDDGNSGSVHGSFLLIVFWQRPYRVT